MLNGKEVCVMVGVSKHTERFLFAEDLRIWRYIHHKRFR